jgi:hypothetical protein
MSEWPYSGAVISDCGAYRFNLWRCVEPLIFEPGRGDCLFVMNNPSTADAKEDDPTIRRVKGFAAAWGFSKIYVANTNPYRATDPKAAQVPPEDVLALNDQWIGKLSRQVQWVVAAWGGKANRALAERALTVIRRFRPVHAIALSKDGQPKHPLYLPGDSQPFVWRQFSGEGSNGNP